MEPLTNNPYVLALLGGSLVAATSFGLTRLLLGRRLRELGARIEKSERARAAVSQQMQQARKQIETLQKELATQHKARADAVLARKRAESRDREQEARESRRGALDSLLMSGDETPTKQPAHGFADTMPFLGAEGAAR